jgi:hypothetical protein
LFCRRLIARSPALIGGSETIFDLLAMHARSGIIHRALRPLAQF